MPSQQPLDEQIYTAMQSGKAFQFNITTGGVKYRAVLRHKEARYALCIPDHYSFVC